MLARLAGVRRPRPSRSTGWTTARALNAVGIRGGIAGNVIPDSCVVTVNYRFAPDKTPAGGARRTCASCSRATTWRSPTRADGARPGLHLPAAKAFVEALGVPVAAK